MPPPLFSPLGLWYEAGVVFAPDVGSYCYSVDEDCCFGAGGVPVGAKQSQVASGDYYEVGQPSDAGCVEGVGFYVRVVGWLADVVGFCVAVQEGGHLSSGYVIFGAELPLGVPEVSRCASEGDFVLDCPADGLVGVDAFCYVGEGF